MTTTVRASKQSARPALLERKRLLEQLDNTEESSLIVLAGPAGYGKTMLARQWAATRNTQPVAWLNVEPRHRDPSEFTVGLVDAITAAAPPINSDAVAVSSLNHKQAISELQALSSTLPGLIVVFDNWDIAEGSPAEALLLQWLSDKRCSRRDVLAGRSRFTGEPLGRKVTVLDADSMAFDDEETRSLVSQAAGRSWDRQVLKGAVAAAEGWPVAIQMVAETLATDQRMPPDLALRAARGDIEEYVGSAVLVPMDATDREMLTLLSALDPFCPDLADAALERADSSERIDLLRSRNTFVSADKDAPGWWRIHPLVREALLETLERDRKDDLGAVAASASKWFLSKGLTSEGLRYAMLSGDNSTVAQLLESADVGIANQANLDELLTWTEAGRIARGDEASRLSMTVTWTLALSGQLEQAKLQAFSILDTPSDHDDWAIGVAHLTIAYCAGMWAESAALSSHCHKALEFLPNDADEALAYAHLMLGVAYRVEGNLVGAAQSFSRSIAHSTTAGSAHLTIDALWEKAVLEEAQGKRRAATQTCRRGLMLAQQQTRLSGKPVASASYLIEREASLLLEEGRSHAAVDLAKQAVETSVEWGQADAVVMSRLTLAQILLGIGRPQESMDHVEQASKEAASLGGWYAEAINRERVRTAIATDDTAAVEAYLGGKTQAVTSESSLLDRQGELLRLQALLSIGALDETHDQATRLLPGFEISGAFDAVIRTLIILAVSSSLLGRQRDAQDAIGRALRLAEPEGYFRVFTDEGTRIAPLLADAMDRGVTPEYCQSLINAIEPANDKLIDSLTSRELEVLTALASSMKVDEIAVELFISPSTVRTHVKAIYRKLGVNRRLQAVERAHELRLIAPTGT